MPASGELCSEQRSTSLTASGCSWLPAWRGIVYDSTCNKYFPIVTRYQTNNNDRLIIAIMVEQDK